MRNVLRFACRERMMETLEWGEFLTTGNASVDRGHREILERLNAFLDDDASASADVFRRKLRQLCDTTTSKLEEEARWMQAIGWPEYSRHVDNHRQLLEFFAHWKQKSETAWRSWFAVSLFAEIGGWLIQHMWEEDRRLDVYRKTGRVMPAPRRVVIPFVIPAVPSSMQKRRHDSGEVVTLRRAG